MLSYAKTCKEYQMAKDAIQSLRSSSPEAGMRVLVVETNANLPRESFVDKELFGKQVEVIYPECEFGFNKFLKAGHDYLQQAPSQAKYLVVMNNDVTLFNPGFMNNMLTGMQSVASASPLGLREATWGLVNRSVPIDMNYDINRSVNGWFLMLDKKILNAMPFEKLFPPEFTWYGGDIYYAQLLEKCGYKHGLINNAQALHLQKQSHELRMGARLAPPINRDVMLKALNLKDKTCVEIGVQTGVYAGTILAENPKSLLLVDPWKHQPDSVYPQSDTSNVDDVKFERYLQTVKSKFDNDPRVTICRAFSVQAAKLYKPESLDFVYIDAIHTTQAVTEDICAWWPLIKSDGWLCGHDYSHPDVAAAVNAFVKQNCLTLDFVTLENGPATSWGLKKPGTGSETAQESEVSYGM
jgi:hypothetical protein